MSDIPTFTMRELMEAGVHFGHDKRRWNPKMAKYIYGTRDKVHIMDLQQTVPLLHEALEAVKDIAAKNGKVLFVGTKRAASEPIKAAAERCGQYYVNSRWLGGMLTNWKTVSQSVKRLKDIEAREEKGEFEGLTKKEKQGMLREKQNLSKSLGGIKDMGGKPDIIFVIDAPKEELAIAEAERLSIPVVAILDSNANPEGIAYPVPGNDDATKAINLYCDLICRSVLAGIKEEMTAAGVDLGAASKVEEVPAEEKATADAE